MPVKAETRKTPFFQSLFRSQFASVTATLVDFIVTIFLTELLAVWYVVSTATGAFCGGVVSFTLCRRWVFKRRDQRWHHQAVRYILAVGLSLLLNTAGVWALTEAFHISYLYSKIITAIIVGVFVNFPVFRYFVFR